MMNMVSNVFDFFRNIFAWADRNTRKRSANEALAYEPEFVSSNKRLRSNESFYGKEIFIDLANDENDENDDIQILSEYHSSPLRSSTQMSNNRGNKRHSFPSSKTNSCRAPQPKSSSYHCTGNNSNMGNINGKSLPVQNMGIDCKHYTLSRTLRLQEKRQYGEMLQNFVPRRVQVLHTKPEKNPVSPVEVIELDKSEESRNSQKSIPVQKRQLYTPLNQEQDRFSLLNRRRSDCQPSISRIQVEKEEMMFKTPKAMGRRSIAGEISFRFM